MFHEAWSIMLWHSAETDGFTCVDIYHAFNCAHTPWTSNDPSSSLPGSQPPRRFDEPTGLESRP
jgi:hypothetical protein